MLYIFEAVLNLSGVLLSTLERAATRTTHPVPTKVTSSESSSILQPQKTPYTVEIFLQAYLVPGKKSTTVLCSTRDDLCVHIV